MTDNVCCLHSPDSTTPIDRTRGPWLISAEGQRTIAGFRINGEPLFFAAAGT